MINWKRGIKIFLAFWLLSACPCLAQAAQVTLAWDPNDPTPDGYRLYQRQEGNAYDYSAPAWSGSTASATVDDLFENETYFFVVRAYVGADESGDSNEVSYNSYSGEPTYFQITLNQNAGGTVYPPGPLSVLPGSSTVFDIVAQEGYAVLSISLNGISQALGRYLTISSISSDQVIDVVFENDLDRDGIADSLDPDRDGDLVANEEDDFPDDPNASSDINGNGIPDYLDEDMDGDLIKNYIEVAEGTDPRDPDDFPEIIIFFSNDQVLYLRYPLTQTPLVRSQLEASILQFGGAGYSLNLGLADNISLSGWGWGNSYQAFALNSQFNGDIVAKSRVLVSALNAPPPALENVYTQDGNMYWDLDFGSRYITAYGSLPDALNQSVVTQDANSVNIGYEKYAKTAALNGEIPGVYSQTLYTGDQPLLEPPVIVNPLKVSGITAVLQSGLYLVQWNPIPDSLRYQVEAVNTADTRYPIGMVYIYTSSTSSTTWMPGWTLTISAYINSQYQEGSEAYFLE